MREPVKVRLGFSRCAASSLDLDVELDVVAGPRGNVDSAVDAIDDQIHVLRRDLGVERERSRRPVAPEIYIAELVGDLGYYPEALRYEKSQEQPTHDSTEKPLYGRSATALGKQGVHYDAGPRQYEQIADHIHVGRYVSEYVPSGAEA